MTATATRPAASPSDGELSHRQILTILSGLVMGMFLAALDQNIVSTAIKTIGNDLHDLKAQAWVTTAFLITTTIAAPLFGKLSDIYGRKRLFMLSIVIFTIGSALCGLATSMYELAGFRAFQGIGAGGIMPLAMAVIGDIIPPRERARYQGYMMAVFASASVLGPVLGGLLSGASDFLGVAGWRWIFYINVPLAAAALIVVARVLRLDHARRERRIDWWGSVMLAVGLVPLLVVAEQGQSWGWASVASFTCYVLGAAGLALFVVIQHRMGDDALLPLRLFRSPTFSVASGQVTIIGMAMFGGLAVIPLYLQIVKGASPTRSGLLLLPMVAGLMLASLGSGRLIARTGRYKVFPVVGSVLMVIGMGLLVTVGADTPLGPTDIYMTVFGLGLGLNMQSLVLAMQNAVPAKDMGVASASSSFFRSVGGTLGTAIFLSILFSEAGTKIGQQYAKAATDPAYLAAAKANPAQVTSLHQHLSGGLDDTSFLNGLARPLVHPFFVGFSSAGDVVFAVTAILLLAAVVLSACLKEVPLRQVSGNQARAQAEGSAGASEVLAAHGAAAEPAGAVGAPGAGDAVGDATRTLVRNKGLTIEEET
jgi:EmrB/QacA subfamily drug resistance transporter